MVKVEEHEVSWKSPRRTFYTSPMLATTQMQSKGELSPLMQAPSTPAYFAPHPDAVPPPTSAYPGYAAPHPGGPPTSAYAPHPGSGYAAAPPQVVAVIVQNSGATVQAWPGLSSAQVGAAKDADTLGVLAHAPGGVYVQRQLQILTLLVDFEQRFTLYCHNWTPTADENANPKDTADFNDTLLRMKEDSSCFIRFCIGGLRPFRMAVFPYSKAANYPPKEMDVFSLPNAVTLERPFRFPILCLWRPLLRVRHNTRGYIAQVRMPFTFFHPHFDILAPSDGGDPGVPVEMPRGAAPGQLLYKVRGDFCQGGLWFPNCPCICRRVRFMVYLPGDTAFATPVGEIDRVFRDCASAMLEKDAFTARFPADASPEMRLAILTSVLLVEMQVFEDRENKGFLCRALEAGSRAS